MAQTKNTYPMYDLVTTTLAETITLALDSRSVNANQNEKVIDFDITLGNATLNLPSIQSLITGGSGFTSFKIKGSIRAGAPPRTLTLHPDATEGDADTICGDTTVTIAGVSSCFNLWIAGQNIWGLSLCNPSTQS